MYIVLAIKMYYRSVLVHVSVLIYYVHVINLLLYFFMYGIVFVIWDEVYTRS